MANSFSEVANFIVGLFSCIPRPFQAMFVVFLVLTAIVWIVNLVFRG